MHFPAATGLSIFSISMCVELHFVSFRCVKRREEEKNSILSIQCVVIAIIIAFWFLTWESNTSVLISSYQTEKMITNNQKQFNHFERFSSKLKLTNKQLSSKLASLI